MSITDWIGCKAISIAQIHRLKLKHRYCSLQELYLCGPDWLGTVTELRSALLGRFLPDPGDSCALFGYLPEVADRPFAAMAHPRS